MKSAEPYSCLGHWLINTKQYFIKYFNQADILQHFKQVENALNRSIGSQFLKRVLVSILKKVIFPLSLKVTGVMCIGSLIVRFNI